ncbi:hypothetical protein [Sinimarinibacterium sp. NLF-5-8]|uniref:hypothetical protein n=1 Tax=Sinimarinibacterium sp. NLF-5-8 TaxID=2698684 RepID=UPI00137C2514|nr:hypothetical protein [Sinimarinibacterium sp. NLF-5-8]QHS09002.1 hypothetical protein GT972_01825 [Sinimarinibacterium sp. NLF-5-8]
MIQITIGELTRKLKTCGASVQVVEKNPGQWVIAYCYTDEDEWNFVQQKNVTRIFESLGRAASYLDLQEDCRDFVVISAQTTASPRPVVSEALDSFEDVVVVDDSSDEPVSDWVDPGHELPEVPDEIALGGEADETEEELDHLLTTAAGDL